MLLCSFVLLSCERDIPVVEAIDYNPTFVAFDVPNRFPTPNLPAKQIHQEFESLKYLALLSDNRCRPSLIDL